MSRKSTAEQDASLEAAESGLATENQDTATENEDIATENQDTATESEPETDEEELIEAEAEAFMHAEASDAGYQDVARGKPAVLAILAEVGHAFGRLYRGETSFDFVRRRRWWYLISSIIIVAGLGSVITRGLNLGIQFNGGTSWEVTAPGVTPHQARAALSGLGLGPTQIEVLGGKTLQVQADLTHDTKAVASRLTSEVTSIMAKLAHTSVSGVSITNVGPTWGGEITQKAIIALIVFFVAIALYISLRFEWKMALAAIVAVIHDILVTLGVYSLAGFQVTPDTVIAFLTVLGYSLYDTIVVFDRVKENAKGLGATGKMTYEDVVNLSMNQTLARSVNTSLVAIFPVLSVLVLGADIMGATTLQYFGLALLIGLTSGAYSSIFIASPLLASLKEREPRYASLRQKLAARGEDMVLLTPKAAAATYGDTESLGAGRPGRSGQGRRQPALVGASEVLVPGAAKGSARGAAKDSVAKNSAPRSGSAKSSGSLARTSGTVPRAAAPTGRTAGNGASRVSAQPLVGTGVAPRPPKKTAARSKKKRKR